MKTAWYLGHSAKELGSCAILVGDPDRVERIGVLLEDSVYHPVKRGLKTVTGTYNKTRVSVAAFGMGAPIATIVMHELADLGLRRFVRIGTAMHFPPALPGGFLISQSALSFEGTSASYAISDSPPMADAKLVEDLEAATIKNNAQATSGVFATFDAFYRDMFSLEPAAEAKVTQTRHMLQKRGVLATDMETSALLTAAQALSVACATLCLGTVDGISQEKLEPDALSAGEQLMFRIALDAITARHMKATENKLND